MTEPKKNNNCWVCLCAFLFGILFFITIAGHVWMTIEKVRTGHGFEVLNISPKFRVNYIGLLTFYIIVAISIILSPLIYWFSTKEERSFKKKYHIDE